LAPSACAHQAKLGYTRQAGIFAGRI